MLIGVVLRVDFTGIKFQVVSVVSVVPGRGPPPAAARSTLTVQQPIIGAGVTGYRWHINLEKFQAALARRR